jgi:hypothetical protein
VQPSFAGGLLHAATVLCLPVAVVAVLLLYCASGDAKWKKPPQQGPESKPLVRLRVRVRAAACGRAGV